MTCAATKLLSMSGQNLFGKTLCELQTFLTEELGVTEQYRAAQLFRHIYSTTETRAMHDIPGSLRERLLASAIIFPGRVKTTQTSRDGTKKFLICGLDGVEYESVLIAGAEGDKMTLCVSSQVGCSFDCTFCHTGTQPVQRNLTAAEVVGQYALIQAHAGVDRPITNVVFMGQGEPLLNFRNVGKAIQLLKDAYSISNHRITVSTSGVVKAIPMVADFKARLAVSLHAPNDALRHRLMPSTRHQGTMQDLMAACAEYSVRTSGSNRRITFEYILLRHVNDNSAAADELGELLRSAPFKSHVNLLPFHRWPGSTFEPSGNMRAFRERLRGRHGIQCTARPSRGLDIMAACGQLKSS